MNRKGAIELSIGTIVIIVLAMSMLILGLILVRDIFSGSTEAVDAINKGVISEINKLFTDDNKKIAISPSTQEISIKQGARSQGFAFSVRNNNIEEKSFSFVVEVDPDFNIQQKCQIGYSEANSWAIIDSGSFTLGPGQKMDDPELVLFNLPENAPPCTIPYRLDISIPGEGSYDYRKVYLTVLPA